MWEYCWQEKTLCCSRMALPSQQCFIDFCELLTHSFQEYSGGWWCGLVLLLWWNLVKKILGVALPRAQCSVTHRLQMESPEPSRGGGIWTVATPVYSPGLGSSSSSVLVLLQAIIIFHSTLNFFFKKCINVTFLSYLGRFDRNLFTGQEESIQGRRQRQVREGKCSL